MRFVVCIDSGDSVDLQSRRLYRVLTDVKAAAEKMLRVVDDSGEDYLYPANYFLPVKLTDSVAAKIRRLN
ncbi:MAG: hypothetical protein C0483_15485 [Pirellula sp.]|nr:hypothetical protein [Pirellula sp.]